jgi:hypothetical protein
MNAFIQTLINQSFIQNILLLLLTAALTGFLVPFIKAKIDQKDSQRQKIFEADLDQQKKLRDYQAKLLDDLDEVLWQYQFLALEPTYYKMRENETGYTDAIQQYDQKAPALLSQIRTQVSKARRFASAETYQKCSDLYYKQLINRVDVWLIQLVEKGSSQYGDWTAHHAYCYYDVGKYIDEVLYLLAHEFGVTSQNSKSRVDDDKK